MSGKVLKRSRLRSWNIELYRTYLDGDTQEELEGWLFRGACLDEHSAVEFAKDLAMEEPGKPVRVLEIAGVTWESR